MPDVKHECYGKLSVKSFLNIHCDIAGGQGDFGLTAAENTSSDSESEDKDDTKRVTFKLDDWLNFKVDSEVFKLKDNRNTPYN